MRVWHRGSFLLWFYCAATAIKTPPRQSLLAPYATYTELPAIHVDTYILNASNLEFETFYVQAGQSIIVVVDDGTSRGIYFAYQVESWRRVGDHVRLDLATGSDTALSTPLVAVVADLAWLAAEMGSSRQFDKDLARRFRGSLIMDTHPSDELHQRIVLDNSVDEIRDQEEKGVKSQEAHAKVLNTVVRTYGEPRMLAWLLRHVRPDDVFARSEPQSYCTFFSFRLGSGIYVHVHQESRFNRDRCRDNGIHAHGFSGFASLLVKGQIAQTTYATPPSDFTQPLPTSPNATVKEDVLEKRLQGCDSSPLVDVGSVWETRPLSCAPSNFAALSDAARCGTAEEDDAPAVTRRPKSLVLRGACSVLIANQSYYFPAYWMHRICTLPGSDIRKPPVTFFIQGHRKPFFQQGLPTAKTTPPMPRSSGERYRMVLDRLAAYIAGERQHLDSLDELLYNSTADSIA